jgi:hypothetical protein
MFKLKLNAQAGLNFLRVNKKEAENRKASNS